MSVIILTAVTTAGRKISRKTKTKGNLSSPPQGHRDNFGWHLYNDENYPISVEIPCKRPHKQESKVKMFSDKQKLKGFVASKPAMNEILTNFFPAEAKWTLETQIRVMQAETPSRMPWTGTNGEAQPCGLLAKMRATGSLLVPRKNIRNTTTWESLVLSANVVQNTQWSYDFTWTKRC